MAESPPDAAMPVIQPDSVKISSSRETSILKLVDQLIENKAKLNEWAEKTSGRSSLSPRCSSKCSAKMMFVYWHRIRSPNKNAASHASETIWKGRKRSQISAFRLAGTGKKAAAERSGPGRHHSKSTNGTT
jgi:hypothetical protein